MADVRNIEDGLPVDFPSDPSHGDTFEVNGLVYVYVDQDEGGNKFKEGHWNLVGIQGPTGPSGNPGRAGTDGRYPTIDRKTGSWIYNWSDVDKDGNEIDSSSPSNYPAQGVLRLLGIVAKVGDLPDAKKANMGDCYFVSDGSTAGDLYVIVFHEDRLEDGTPDTKFQNWVNMGQLGLEGPKGAVGDKGDRGETGKAICEVVDVLPTGSWEPGTIYMEKNTNHLFIAIEPQGIS